MGVSYNEKTGVFSLSTKHSVYQMQVGPFGYLLHLYYGDPVGDTEISYRIRYLDRGFSGNPPEAGDDRTFSTDTVPQEYPTSGGGDYRGGSLRVVYADGSRDTDLRYVSHRIFPGKPALDGLPAIYGTDGEFDTLQIILADPTTKLEVVLSYSVFDEGDVIARSAAVRNGGGEAVRLLQIPSCSVDFLAGEYDFLSFYGRHAMERNLERTAVRHGKIRVDSARGTSSHQQNPFVILCESGANEEYGRCWGMSFVYSGNFFAQAEEDQLDQIRLGMGVNDAGFEWRLGPGEVFTAPEVVLCYSGEGLGELSRRYHRVYRNHLCRGEWKTAQRPILINNWEATYFDFDDEKLVRIAQDAAQLGIDMLVMDDGWFGKRDSDTRSLGDWIVNRDKIRGGLDGLCRRINALGLKLGIWFEPEMISEDSDLYRKHPEWTLRSPGRAGVRSRFQYVLDMSRQDVQDYLFNAIHAVLSGANIEYVKWDMNRHLANVWSAALPPERQGEVSHRYVLGLYALLERLTAAFPHVLFEGCSGGGGRFDAGMLYYTPQIWCSDDTDCIERLKIQYGTSFGYPVSAVGSHLSASPNHQTGRGAPFHTRGAVAMSGTFGYELDINKLSDEEKSQIRRQTSFFRKHYRLIQDGDYYRLTNPFENPRFAAWLFVSPDKSCALLTVVLLQPRANPPIDMIRLRGLDPAKQYAFTFDGKPFDCSGAALMHAGLSLPEARGEYTAMQIEIQAK